MIKNLKKDAYETRFGLVMDKKGVSAFVISSVRWKKSI